VTNRCGSLQ